MTTEAASYTGWAVVEFLGHVKRAGHVSAETQYGVSLMRLDIPQADGTMATEYRHPSTLYCLTPTTEDVARAVARHHQPSPASPWELRDEEPRRQLGPAPRRVFEDAHFDDCGQDDDDDDDPMPGNGVALVTSGAGADEQDIPF